MKWFILPTRKVVGWEVAAHLRAELVFEALDMAAERRNPEKTIRHSAQGGSTLQLPSERGGKKEGVRPSMGSVGDCYDNPM